MRKAFLIGLALTVAACGVSPFDEFEVYTGQERAHQAAYVPNQLVVRFQSNASASAVSGLLSSHGGRLMSNGRNKMGVSLVQTAGDAAGMAQGLSASPLVEYAEPNYVYSASYIPSDPMAHEHQKDLGFMQMHKAWSLTLGDPRIPVAFVDTGVDLTHPDLKPKILKGYNAITKGQTPPQDEEGHGTHVAGLIGAATDNRVGIAGVAPRCPLMPVRALQGYGTQHPSGSLVDIAEGIIWAADNGARVINLSLGGAGSAETLRRAVQYALSKRVVVVAAMGNERSDLANYPAAYPGVIAVGAVDGWMTDNEYNPRPEDWRLSKSVGSYSNYGTWISVVAPGTTVFSTLPVKPTKSSDPPLYGLKTGTSMAAPIVSGVVALMLSRYPNMTPAEVKAKLESTAQDLQQPGFDIDTGYGLVDPYRAIL